MDTKLAAVLEKVAKLRALAARATTQAEAETAAAQAEALIAKYQIDEAQIASTNPEREEAIGAEEDPLYRNPSSYSQQWLASLATGIGNIHGCFVYQFTHRRSGERTVDLRIVGRPSDVAIVRYMFAWLHSEIMRLSRNEYGKGRQNAFRIGAVHGVLFAMRNSQASEIEAAKKHSPGVAMVLVNRAALSEQHAKKMHSGWYTSRPNTKDDSGAYDRGKTAGSHLAPKPGLGAAGGTKLLGK